MLNLLQFLQMNDYRLLSIKIQFTKYSQLQMRFYHYDTKKWISLQQLPQDLTHFQLYHRGTQISVKTKGQLSSKFQAIKDGFIVVKNKKAKEDTENQIDLQGLIHNLSKQEQLNANQIDLFRQYPKSLFEKRLYTFKYTLESEDKGILKQRKEQLLTDLRTGGTKWKEANLEELQAITSKYDQILDDLCQNL